MLNQPTNPARPHCTCVEIEFHMTDACDWCIAFCEYSDRYKEEHGIRPRSPSLLLWTADDFQAAIDAFPKYDHEREAREREAARLRAMPLSGAGWCVHFAGDPEVARDRFMEEAGLDPVLVY